MKLMDSKVWQPDNCSFSFFTFLSVFKNHIFKKRSFRAHIRGCSLNSLNFASCLQVLEVLNAEGIGFVVLSN